MMGVVEASFKIDSIVWKFAEEAEQAACSGMALK